jgi:hypothetical protein
MVLYNFCGGLKVRFLEKRKKKKKIFSVLLGCAGNNYVGEVCSGNDNFIAG